MGSITNICGRGQLLENLKGQRVCLPDLRPIFAGWPGAYHQNINHHYREMIAIANEKLERLVKEEREACTEILIKRNSLFTKESKLAKLKASDFALFASSWWPQAGLEELRILTFLAIWLFTWDDEIDEPTGFCADDFKAAQEYRQETIAFVEDCLDLRTRGTPSIPSNAIVASFQVIGEYFRDTYTLRKT